MPWKESYPGQTPSLGPYILSWIRDHLCHGPGDLQGVRVSKNGLRLGFDREIIEFVTNMYEIHPVTGRRKYTQEILSRQKGRAKSEVAGFLVVAEAVGPCRFEDWDENGKPILRKVTGPLIKCLASEESQAGNTFEVVSYIMSDWGPDNEPELFAGITGARTYQSATALYLPTGGEIRMCSSGAASKDGGKETFVVADETHLYVTTELKNMYATIARNLGSKRKLSEPHLLQTSTAPRQGEQSVYEETLALWKKGELPETTLFDHREAKGAIRIRDKEHTMAQLYELWGPEASQWQDMDRKYADMIDPLVCRDEADAARYYLNRMIAGSDAWIPLEVHEKQMKKSVVNLGEPITLGFDGSLNDDTTVLRGCRMSDGYLFKLGTWAKPAGAAGVGWQVPRLEVIDAIHEAHSMYQVVRGYYDPHEWASEVEALAQRYDVKDRKGKVVTGVAIPFFTRSDTRMSDALNRLHTALMTGEVFHDDDPIAAEHYGNAKVRRRGKLVLVKKEYPNSPRKIDSVVGDALAYEARADAIADGWDQPKTGLTRVKGRARGY